MKTFTTMRASAWSALWGGGWFFRCSAVIVVFMVIFNLAERALLALCGDVVLDLENLRNQALNGNVVDFSAVFQKINSVWCLSAAFVVFIGSLVSGFDKFALTSVSVRAAASYNEKWFVSSFDGLRRPFEVLWLLMRKNLQILLWMMLFIVPGIIAAYRYRLVWYLKVENPDMSPSECFRESCRLMNGRKWHMFKYDCTYFMYLPAVVVVFLFSPDMLGSFAFLLWVVFFSVGSAVYYREMKSSES